MIYLTAFTLSLVLVLLLTPFARRLALWLGVVDMPQDRKVHENPTPTLGGVAILLAVVLSLLVCKLLVSYSPAMAGPQ